MTTSFTTSYGILLCIVIAAAGLASLPPDVVTLAEASSSPPSSHCPLQNITPTLFTAMQDFQGGKTLYNWYFSPCTSTRPPGRENCHHGKPSPGRFFQLDKTGTGSCETVLDATQVVQDWKMNPPAGGERGGYSAQFRNSDGSRLVRLTVNCDLSSGNLKANHYIFLMNEVDQFVYDVELSSAEICSELPPPPTPPPTPSPAAPTTTFLSTLTVFPMFVGLVGKWELDPLIKIMVGTPPQPVNLVFDTGSFLPVVNNASCDLPACGQGRKYDSSKSTTAEVNFTRRVTQSYGSGNNSGYPTKDVFHFTTNTNDGSSSSGGSEDKIVEGLSFTEAFLACDRASFKEGQTGLEHIPTYSGILGMGPFEDIASNINTTSKILTEQFGIGMVTVKLPRGPSVEALAAPADGNPLSSWPVLGSVQFGGYDLLNPSKGSKEPVWATNYPKEPYFLIEIQDILFNGQSTGVCSAEKKEVQQQCKALIDTGSGILEFAAAGLPNSAPTTAAGTGGSAASRDNDYSDSSSATPSSSGGSGGGTTIPNTIDCDKVASLPKIGVVIAGTTFTLEPRDYIIRIPPPSLPPTLGGGGGDSSHDTLVKTASSSPPQCQTTLVAHSPSPKNTEEDRHHLSMDDILEGKKFRGGEKELSGEKSSSSPSYVSHLIYTHEDLMASTNQGSQPAFLDLGIQWTSRVTTIFDWKNNRVGFIENNEEGDNNNSAPKSGNLSTAVIVGIVIGSIVGAVVLLHVTVHCAVVIMKKKKTNNTNDDAMASSATHSGNDDEKSELLSSVNNSKRV